MYRLADGSHLTLDNRFATAGVKIFRQTIYTWHICPRLKTGCICAVLKGDLYKVNGGARFYYQWIVSFTQIYRFECDHTAHINRSKLQSTPRNAQCVCSHKALCYLHYLRCRNGKSPTSAGRWAYLIFTILYNDVWICTRQWNCVPRFRSTQARALPLANR